VSTTETPKTYDEAIVALQARLPKVQKARTAKVEMKGGGTYTYKYANLSNISDQMLPLLAGLGLSWQTMPRLNAAGTFVLYYRLWHVSDSGVEGEWPITHSGTMQSVGSAITYARRYALCAVTGLAPEDDDDDAAKASQQEAEQAKGRGRTQRRSTQPTEDGRITAAQQKKLGELFTALGTTDKARRLAIAGRVVKKELTASTEMTEVEAKTLIDTLAPMVKAGEDGPLLLADLMRQDGEPDAAA
jgi:hypothetical protein